MLRGSVAIVTGSTSGIGLGIARRLLIQGMTVILQGTVTPIDLDQLLGKLSVLGNVDYYPADLAVPADIQWMIPEVERRHGRVDLLVNHGVPQVCGHRDHPPAELWQRMLATTISAAYHAIRSALPGMQRRGYGRIVNLICPEGPPEPSFAAMHRVARYAMIGLTQAVAVENSGRNITCNTLYEQPRPNMQVSGFAGNDRLFDAQQCGIRAGTPAANADSCSNDLSDVLIFLCGVAGRAINGASLPVGACWTDDSMPSRRCAAAHRCAPQSALTTLAAAIDAGEALQA